MTRRRFNQGVKDLAARDPDLARVVDRFGPPPLWTREPGFPTLVHLILEQQVSLASAKAAFDRLREAADPLTPAGFLRLSDARLKKIGYSRQKTAYTRDLATAVDGKRLDLDALPHMKDAAVRDELMRVKGIGRWTADCYLLMALRRSDIWPVGDMALQVAARHIKRLRKRPSPERLDRLGTAWKPWRAVAARILWHYYLST